MIDGATVYQSSDRTPIYNGTAIASGTYTLTHGTDGNKTFSAYIEGAIFSFSVNNTASGSWELPTIARTSSIISAADVTIGNYCNIKWAPASKDFAFRVNFSIGNWSQLGLPVRPATTNSYTYVSDRIPEEVANQIPNTKTGTMTVTLYTYPTLNDATNKTNLVGTSTATFIVTVPSSLGPKAAMALSPVSSLGSTFSGMYIQGKTKVQADFSGSAGQYGATIKSYSLTVEGVTDSTSPYQSDYLKNSGSVEVKGTVTDSRGYSTVITKTITVIQYSSPAIVPYTGEKSIVCARCTADGTLSSSGTYLRIKTTRKYSKVLNGTTQKNFCLLGYRYVASGGTLPATFTTLIAKETTTTDVIDVVVSGVTLAVASSYTVQLHVADDIGGTSTLTFAIPTETVTMHLKKNGKGVGIGKYAETDDLFDVGWDAKFRKSINGCYMKSFYLSGKYTFTIQTKYSTFDEGGGNRQSILLFGRDNALVINGLITLDSAGVTSWTGTGDVTIAKEGNGRIVVTLPRTAYDTLVAISGDYFEIIA